MGARLTVLAALALRACQASRDCGDVRCGEHERCCARGNASTSNGNGGAAARAFLDGAGWLARKLSGVLILLLLFAMGYFVQRVVCPRPRGRRERARASRDTLLTTPPPPLETGTEFAWPAPLPPPPPPRLPAYEEVKHLPTYEESVQEAEEEEEEGLGGRRSEDNLLEAAGALGRLREERRTAARQSRSSRNSYRVDDGRLLQHLPIGFYPEHVLYNMSTGTLATDAADKA
ncbi:hypothetical protein NFI96_000005 [Prochilodus magdalenae]|nr:hypothetical protein NFI96_000005 [Prochilodus magdalenae]